MTKKKQLSCVFALAFAPLAHAQSASTEIVLHNFRGSPDGQYPMSGVIADGAGNLYGTTYVGGTVGFGAVYKIDAAGQDTVLYSFTGGADGGNPQAGLIRDGSGNLYGTTTYGGTDASGVVYKLDAAGHETVLYTFTGGADGRNPDSAVIRDAAGNLYGTAPNGGTAGAGVVYKVNANGHETTLYSFMGAADGASPRAGVIRDGAGNLYGTTTYGGTANSGVVYKLDAAGKETLLYSFTGGTDGANPTSGVIRDASGNLYGTTNAGGAAGEGVVYKLDPAGQETVLYSFTGAPNGGINSAVIRDRAGNLYGTTQFGGNANAGAVYELDAAGQQTVLFSFTRGADGAFPLAVLIRDAAGNLYGTTQTGGQAEKGVVFKIKAAALEPE